MDGAYKGKYTTPSGFVEPHRTFTYVWQARAGTEGAWFYHDHGPLATGLNNQFSCINGRAYAGNTPTLRAKVGETVAWHVFALDDDFHAFHLHGHRWID